MAGACGTAVEPDRLGAAASEVRLFTGSSLRCRSGICPRRRMLKSLSIGEAIWVAHWQSYLERWHVAGLLDQATMERIRAWEAQHDRSARHSRLTQIIFGLGGLLLAAGVLLFVAAHWDEISPALRFVLVLLLAGVFHVLAGVFATRVPSLATTLHAAGTAAFGAGIFLTGQIFNMAEHWPAALLLWAVGAAIALALLRDWPHVLWVAVLIPAWLVGEWIKVSSGRSGVTFVPAVAGCVLLALVYMSARGPSVDSVARTALARLGGFALIPLVIWFDLIIRNPEWFSTRNSGPGMSPQWQLLAWAVALLIPAAVAFGLRKRDALWLIPAILWVLVSAVVGEGSDAIEVVRYALYALGAVGIILWGLREQQPFTVNVGIVCFALTIIFFYFASVFDRLGRSLGLIVMGIVFIGGGWMLERLRRELVGRIGRSPA